MCIFKMRGEVMWFVIQVRSGMERDMMLQYQRIVPKSILKDSFTPEFEYMKRYKGAWHKEKNLLFPGYIFVRTDDPTVLYQALKSVIGLSKILDMGGELIPLTKEEVRMIELLDHDRVLRMSRGYIKDHKVYIKEGPLKSYETSIKKVDRHKRKAWFEVEIFGRMMYVCVGLEIPEKFNTIENAMGEIYGKTI